MSPNDVVGFAFPGPATSAVPTPPLAGGLTLVDSLVAEVARLRAELQRIKTETGYRELGKTFAKVCQRRRAAEKKDEVLRTKYEELREELQGRFHQVIQLSSENDVLRAENEELRARTKD